MNSKHHYIVGIDPDCDKSGVALLDTGNRKVSLKTLTFPQLVEYLSSLKALSDILVVVEAGWLIKTNWHVSGNNTSSVAASIGARTGACHQVGKLILLMAEHYGLNVVTRRPLAKCWKGKDKKITHEEITYATGIRESRTNQEERDALLLAWSEARLPLRIKSYTQCPTNLNPRNSK